MESCSRLGQRGRGDLGRGIVWGRRYSPLCRRRRGGRCWMARGFGGGLLGREKVWVSRCSLLVLRRRHARLMGMGCVWGSLVRARVWESRCSRRGRRKRGDLLRSLEEPFCEVRSDERSGNCQCSFFLQVSLACCFMLIVEQTWRLR